MNFDGICDYVTAEEVAERWRLRPGSWMLHRAIMRGVLKPCIFLPGVDLIRMKLDKDGKAVACMDGDAAVVEHVKGWLYPWHEFKEQTAPFDALFPIVSDMCELAEGAQLYALEAPISLAALLASGCVMMPDLLEAETHVKPQEPSTKELNKQLCMISTLLADGYRYDPRQPSGLASEISKAARAHGISLSDGTALKYMRQAFEQFPPSYMAEPLPETVKAAQPEDDEAGFPASTCARNGDGSGSKPVVVSEPGQIDSLAQLGSRQPALLNL